MLVSAQTHLLTRKMDGTDAQVSIPDKRAGDLVYPEFLPGSEDFLALFKPEDGEGEIWLATLSQGTVMNPTVLFKNDTAARYTPWDGGRVLFVKNDNLYSQHVFVSPSDGGGRTVFGARRYTIAAQQRHPPERGARFYCGFYRHLRPRPVM